MCLPGENGAIYKPFDQLLAESDLVTLHCPLTEGNSCHFGNFHSANAASKRNQTPAFRQTICFDETGRIYRQYQSRGRHAFLE